LAELTRVVDEAIAVFGPSTHFGILGGEPLLVDWAPDLAAYIIEKKSPLTLFSNGVPLTHAPLCARVADIVRRGAELRVSLASATAALCDDISGAVRFERALLAINMLFEHGVVPQVDVMVLPEHVELLAEHLPRLRKRLPEQTPLAFGILYPSGREQGEHLFKSRRQLERALDHIVFEAGETIRRTPNKTLTYRREGCTCALGHNLHVRSDGRLYSCFKMDEVVGDLRAQGFAAVAKGEAGRVQPACNLEVCRDCPLNTLCGGGCRSDNLLHTGNPNEPACGEWRKQLCYELLAEDRPDALEWPTAHLFEEARERGLATVPDLLGKGAMQARR
jgi:radical SAM protein with 4Fe4S-binding SPASM domain